MAVHCITRCTVRSTGHGCPLQPTSACFPRSNRLEAGVYVCLEILGNSDFTDEVSGYGQGRLIQRLRFLQRGASRAIEV
jgi:hypothetical protein